jgi:hypothetical protein
VGSGDRHVFDYLAAEVLAGLPPRLRGFVLRTAVLDRFCAPLCDAVMGSVGAADLLEEADRRQLFVVPLDGALGWYRYHALFAAALCGELDRAEPGLAAAGIHDPGKIVTDLARTWPPPVVWAVIAWSISRCCGSSRSWPTGRRVKAGHCGALNHDAPDCAEGTRSVGNSSRA